MHDSAGSSSYFINFDGTSGKRVLINSKLLFDAEFNITKGYDKYAKSYNLHAKPINFSVSKNTFAIGCTRVI